MREVAAHESEGLRPPIYREGDRYHLDPHDEELDLWAFRLGLRPPKVVAPPPKAPEPKPLPGPEVPLTPEELDGAWRRASLYSWSAQRVALCVLDASGGPLTPRDVVAAVAARTEWHSVREHSEYFGTRASKIDVLPDGRWAIRGDSQAALHQARAAARALIEKARRYGVTRTDPRSCARSRRSWTRSGWSTGSGLRRCPGRCWLRSRPRGQKRSPSSM